MRGFDLINKVLPDDLMLQIFRQLESRDSREACSLVCKRWLSLERLSRETIYISTDAHVKLLSQLFVNVVKVTISGRTYLINQFDLDGESVSEENGIRKCCFSDSVLAAVGDGFTKLEILRLMCFPDAIHAGLISIAKKCKLLKSLELEGCRVEDEALAAIGKYCSRLEEINLRDCSGLTDTGFVQLAIGCGRTLKSLDVASFESLTDVALEAVGFHCPSLETLSLFSRFINNEGLLSVAIGCRLLKSLKLHCENMTDEALQAVGSFCLLLEFLSLYRCYKLTDRSLCAIGKGCKKLKKLNLEYCLLLSDVGLDSVAIGCTELVHLNINGCNNIATDGLKSIGKACTGLSKLDLLHMRFPQIENDACEIHIGFKYLQSLHLGYCSGIGDKVLCRIARGCRNLKELHIRGCLEVGNEGIISIGQNCKFLRDLILDFCRRVGDSGIIAIARGCPQLNRLSLTGLENLGDKGMVALGEGCTVLETCDISFCPRITEAGVTTLITSCPNLKKVLVEERKVSPRTKRRAHHLFKYVWTIE